VVRERRNFCYIPEPCEV